MAENADNAPTHLNAEGATREAILAETLRLHDLRYGTAHCDRKYVQVCSRFQALIFEAGSRIPPVSTDGEAGS